MAAPQDTVGSQGTTGAAPRGTTDATGASGASGAARVWRRVGGTRAVALVAGCLAAAWLLPVLTHAVGVDVVLVPLIVVAGASLVRARTVLDQLVIAVVWLFGAVCVGGLVISWWPWGMHPVAVAGAALTALVLLAVATGRRPALRWRRLNAADWVMAGGWVALTGLTLRQFVARDDIGRLALLAPGEDLARHFILFDAIGQLDGYAFLDTDAVAGITPADHAKYPQALHFTAVLLDRFWRSSPDGVRGPAAMDWFVWANVVTFVCFLLLVLWAVRRLAGPALTAGRSVAVLGAAVACLFFGDPVTIFLRGFPNELAALSLVAVAVALLARPLRSTREQIAVLAGMLVALGFTYYLFLPVVAVAVLGWLVTYRRKVLRRPVTLAVGVAVSALAAVPALTNPTANRGSQLLLLGAAIPVKGAELLALVLVVAAGLTAGLTAGSRAALRRYPWRIFTGALLAALGLAGAITGYRFLNDGGGVPYYGEKALHLVLVVTIVGLGAVTTLLPRFAEPPASRSGRWWGRARPLLPAAALALAVFAAFGAIVGPVSSSAGGSYGMGLVRGREGVRRDGPAVAYWGSRRFPDGAGRVTVDLSHSGGANFYGTLYGIAMQRTYVRGVDWYVFLTPGRQARTVEDVELQVLASQTPVRFVVGAPSVRSFTPSAEHPDGMTNAELARYLAEKYPERVEVVAGPR